MPYAGSRLEAIENAVAGITGGEVGINPTRTRFLLAANAGLRELARRGVWVTTGTVTLPGGESEVDPEISGLVDVLEVRDDDSAVVPRAGSWKSLMDRREFGEQAWYWDGTGSLQFAVESEWSEVMSVRYSYLPSALSESNYTPTFAEAYDDVLILFCAWWLSEGDPTRVGVERSVAGFRMRFEDEVWRMIGYGGLSEVTA